MGRTSIEWCDFSINPIRVRDVKTGAIGHYCEKISPGCAHCYASQLQSRFKMKPFDAQRALMAKGRLQVFLDRSKLHDVVSRREPTVWFWEDMSDLFGAWVKPAWLDACFATMALTPHHTHLLLTKRPGRAAEYLTKRTMNYIRREGDKLWGSSDPKPVATWPLPNVRIGTSIENQETADLRLPALFSIPARPMHGYFLSVEPQLGPITLKWAACTCPDKAVGFKTGHRGNPTCFVPRLHQLLDKVIDGGESGPGARPFNLNWPRSLKRQCEELFVPLFVKQLGAYPTWTQIGTKAYDELKRKPKPVRLVLHTKKGNDMAEFPDDIRVRERAQSGTW